MVSSRYRANIMDKGKNYQSDVSDISLVIFDKHFDEFQRIKIKDDGEDINVIKA